MRRRRLRDIELVGVAGKARAIGVRLLAALAGLQVLFYALERHVADTSWSSEEWGPVHSLAGESYYLPVIVPLLAFACAWWARRGAPRAMIAGLIAAANVILVIGAWIANHLFDGTQSASVIGTLAPIATLACGGVGIVMFFADLILPIAERRRLEAAERRPPLPTARVISSRSGRARSPA